jgi:NhaP-type Na+/H+ or K+/H+ antiporter
MLDILPAFMLGAIAAGTSSAVVIPLVRSIKVSPETETMVSIESTITDVLCIIVLLALIEIFELGTFAPTIVIGKILASFLVSFFIGSVGGYFWSHFYHRGGMNEINIFATPAMVLILYAIADLLGFSGAITSLAFGISLANLPEYASHIGLEGKETNWWVELTQMERKFFSQLVDIFKIFFFVYLGLSISASHPEIIIAGIGIVGFIYILRAWIVFFTIPPTVSSWDCSIISIMVPKGLAAAVLAAIPFQAGVVGGALIQEATYIVILFSIILCSVLIYLLENTKLKSIYAGFFELPFRAKIFGIGRD